MDESTIIALVSLLGGMGFGVLAGYVTGVRSGMKRSSALRHPSSGNPDDVVPVEEPDDERAERERAMVEGPMESVPSLPLHPKPKVKTPMAQLSETAQRMAERPPAAVPKAVPVDSE